MVFPEVFTGMSLVHNCLGFHYGYAFARDYFESDLKYARKHIDSLWFNFFMQQLFWLSLRIELAGLEQKAKQLKKNKIKQICFDFFEEYQTSSNTNKTCSLIKTVVKYSNSQCD